MYITSNPPTWANMMGSLPRCGPNAFSKGASTATASDILSVVVKPEPYPGRRCKSFRSGEGTNFASTGARLTALELLRLEAVLGRV